MKNNKDLLQDLFDFFKQKYGKGEVFKAVSSSNYEAKVIKLSIIHHLCKRWAEPALLLVSRRGEELSLIFTANAPDVGFNDEFRSGILEIHSTFQKDNTLYVDFGGVLGGIGNILVLSDQANDDKELSEFQFKLLLKLNELAYSGEYQITRWKKTVAH